ncbi:MAG: hypothetical protein AAFX53_17725 [Bacteroidota bacterium]
MAIHFANNTNENQDLYSFPAFVPNMKDVLYEFNDQTLDLGYIKKHKYGEKALQLAEKAINASSPANRICSLSGDFVKNPQDYIFMGLLTSDEEEELYFYNFLTLDRNNLDKWIERKHFVRVAEEFIASDKWKDLGEFKYLQDLIDQVS